LNYLNLIFFRRVDTCAMQSVVFVSAKFIAMWLDPMAQHSKRACRERSLSEQIKCEASPKEKHLVQGPCHPICKVPLVCG
jgi:hypothetical protein